MTGVCFKQLPIHERRFPRTRRAEDEDGAARCSDSVHESALYFTTHKIV